MPKSLRKPPEGKKLPDTPDMQAWREEFEAMSKEEHLAKLKALGLDDEELAEFEEMESGITPEEELLSQKTIKKKETKIVKKKSKK